MRGALLTLGLAAVLLGGSTRAESAAFGDWIVACDNVRACTAFGFPEDPGADVPHTHWPTAFVSRQ
jgi:hypothetical protein